MDDDLVKALRLRGADVQTALEAGLVGRPDEEHLAHAANEERVLYTFNVGDFMHLHSEYMSAGRAHAALADSLAIYDWNWAESEREFNRSIELNLNVAYTRVAYGTSYLVPTGHAGEAVTQLKRSVDLEPLALINNAVLVSAYLYARQNDKALEQAKKTFDLDRNFGIGRFWLGQASSPTGCTRRQSRSAKTICKNLPPARKCSL
jgi:hypothetical protein